MILRIQIDSKHQCKKFFFNFVDLILYRRGKDFSGKQKSKFLISRKVEHLESKFFTYRFSNPSFLSVCDTLCCANSLFFELFSKTITRVLHAGVSWPNHVRYPLHASKLRLSEPVHTVAAWYCCTIAVPPTVPISRFSCQGGLSLRSRSVNDQAMDKCKFAAEIKVMIC